MRNESIETGPQMYNVSEHLARLYQVSRGHLSARVWYVGLSFPNEHHCIERLAFQSSQQPREIKRLSFIDKEDGASSGAAYAQAHDGNLPFWSI